jgi:hypothetical protein
MRENLTTREEKSLTQHKTCTAMNAVVIVVVAVYGCCFNMIQNKAFTHNKQSNNITDST